jgi:membrane fusion protein (multidrug efflux system)
MKSRIVPAQSAAEALSLDPVGQIPISAGTPQLHPATPPPRPRRARAVFVSLALAAAAVAAGLYVYGRGKESTDDAQVEGRVMTLSARVPGQVARVLVQDNQLVAEGQVLVELDPSDLVARLDAADADLAAARAQELTAEAQLAVTERSAAANVEQARGGLTQAVSAASSSQSAISQATADVSAAESRFKLAESELSRAKALAAENAIPGAQLDTAQMQYDAAQATLAQAKARLEMARSNTSGSTGGVLSAQGRLAVAQTGPEQVQAARAAVALAKAKVKQSESAHRLAELNLSYASVRAPHRGVVSRRTVEVGQMVGPERPLLAVVPTDDVWVVANFKEDQLGDLRVGERARITIDAFRGRVFSGHVDSIAGASGARFALLPPDNATGNYIKVVQRIPVLIRFDGAAGIDLRPGLSADVTVYTR